MPEPWRTIRDDDGLWAFSLFGERDPETVIILLPAMGVPARFYAPLTNEWLDGTGGVAVVQADFVASNLRPRPKPERDGFAALVEDCIRSVLETVRDEFPAAEATIVGHSLGGQLGLVAAGRYAPEIPVTLVACGSVGYRGFTGSHRWGMLVASQVFGLASRVLGYWPGDKLGFGGRQPTALMLDWSRVARTGRYQARTASFDYESALRGYRGEILMITMDGDIYAPRSTAEALVAKTSATAVTRERYSPSRGSAKPGPHFTWVRDHPGLAGRLLNGHKTA